VVCHWPVESHSCAALPLQRAAPGRQTPVQLPPTQAFVQSASELHAPDASHVCGVVPLHRVLAGTHCPEHVPAPEQT
jgi:hypothetical protein